jgi:hypothetical protein
MNLENASYLQVIIAKKFYSQVIIVNHINSQLLPHYSLTLLHKSLYFLEHEKSYVHEKFLLHTHFGQHISIRPLHICKLRS